MTEGAALAEEMREEMEEEDREELGDIAAALAQKADVKKQAKAKVDGVEEKPREGQLRQADGDSEEGGGCGEGPRFRRGRGRQAQRFVRENPAAVAIGGALVAGYALGKLRSR